MPSSPIRDVTGRVRARRRQLLLRRLLVLLVIVLTLALAGLAVWVVWFSTTFDAQEVRVEGASTVSKEQVVAAAKVPIGKPLARIDTTAIADGVKTIPQVKQATVKRRPPHAIVITVTERTPVLAAVSPGGTVLVDADAVGYLPVPAAPDGVRVATLAKDPDQAMLRDLVTLVGALKGAVAPGAISAETRDSFTLTLEGVTVFLGSVDDIGLKVDVANRMLALPDKKKVVDVSSPGRPVLR